MNQDPIDPDNGQELKIQTSSLLEQAQPPSSIDMNARRKLKKRRKCLQAYIFITTYLNYAVLHACRAVWASAMPQIGLGTTWNSTILFCFLFFYALGGVGSGHVADRVKKKNFIFYSYIVIGVCTILMGLNKQWGTINGWAFIFLQIINGLA